MMLFNEDGHFTTEGLHALIDGQLDELQALEAAEHLGFCDPCLEHYTALLTADTLTPPATPLASPVLRRIRRRRTGILLGKYAAIAAAACIAVVVWFTGNAVISQHPSTLPYTAPAQHDVAQTQKPTETEDANPGLGERLNQFFSGFSDATNDLFSGLFTSPPPPQSPPSSVIQVTEKIQENQKKEEVFNKGNPDPFAANEDDPPLAAA